MDSAKIEHGREIWQRLPAHFNLWPLIQAGIISLPSWEINYEELADWFDARAEKEKDDPTSDALICDVRRNYSNGSHFRHFTWKRFYYIANRQDCGDFNQMIPINKENLRAFLIACGVGLGFWLLIWLAGCASPAKAGNLPTKIEPTGPGSILVPMPNMPRFNSATLIGGLQIMAAHPPRCPNKTHAIAVLMPDPGFPDIWRGAFLCNAREVIPVPYSPDWRYVDQKQYGYREWGQK